MCQAFISQSYYYSPQSQIGIIWRLRINTYKTLQITLTIKSIYYSAMILVTLDDLLDNTAHTRKICFVYTKYEMFIHCLWINLRDRNMFAIHLECVSLLVCTPSCNLSSNEQTGYKQVFSFHLTVSHGFMDERLFPCERREQGGSKFNLKKKSTHTRI